MSIKLFCFFYLVMDPLVRRFVGFGSYFLGFGELLLGFVILNPISTRPKNPVKKRESSAWLFAISHVTN